MVGLTISDKWVVIFIGDESEREYITSKRIDGD